MNHTEALEKVRKLLRLSQSSNQHEAALAASRAQEIIDRFKIEKFALEYESATPAAPDEPIRDFEFDPLDKKGGTWKSRLASAIARENQCKVYLCGGAVCLIGRASDVSTVRYIFAWLAREINRLAEVNCAGCGRTYFNNFRIGAVETVSNRLYAQRKQTAAAVKAEAEAVNPHALMVVERALADQEQRMTQVQEWAKSNLNLRSRGGSRSQYNHDAREAGRRAGQSINLRPSSGSLSGGARALNS